MSRNEITKTPVQIVFALHANRNQTVINNSFSTNTKNRNNDIDDEKIYIYTIWPNETITPSLVLVCIEINVYGKENKNLNSFYSQLNEKKKLMETREIEIKFVDQ